MDESIEDLQQQLTAANRRIVELENNNKQLVKAVMIGTSEYEQIFVRKDQAQDAAERKLEALQTAVNFVCDSFTADLEQGYRTKDKEFALAVLGKALETNAKVGS